MVNSKVRPENKVLIIAEAGVNHNGDMTLAKRLVDAAKVAGADIVKFQTFKSENLVSKFAKKADYQMKSTGAQENQLQMLKKLELTEENFIELAQYCQSQQIEFLSTAFDFESLEFLQERIRPRLYKVPSGEMTNLPFLYAHGQTHKDIIISTGMSNMEEVEMALAALTCGFLGQDPKVLGRKDDRSFMKSAAAQNYLKEKVSLLHCTTEYPAPLDQVNLRAMQSMQEKFQLRTGYSDHTEGILIPAAAVAAGARVIEKHFTLDRDMEGPDHKASLNPSELTEMVRQIRLIEMALGSPTKAKSEVEGRNALVVRKSLLAKTDIKKGQTITEDMVTIKRPGSGISPRYYWDVIGMKADRDYAEDEVLDLEISID